MAVAVRARAARNIMVMPCTPPSLGRPKSNGKPALAATSPSPVASMKILPAHGLAPRLGVDQHGRETRRRATTDSTALKSQKRPHAGLVEHPLEDHAHAGGIELVSLGTLGVVGHLADEPPAAFHRLLYEAADDLLRARRSCARC